jgi:ABC-type branched-subunit amino acid transport system substrate-binding protein
MSNSKTRKYLAAASLLSCLAASSPAGAQAANKVTFGAILPLSGLFSTLGPPERDAMMMSIKKIDDAGGFDVAGQHYTLTLKVLDDESNAVTVGISDYRQLVGVDHVPVLVMTDSTRAYASMLKRYPVPALNILDSTWPSILDVNSNVFLLRSDTPAYVPGAVWYLKNVLHKQKIAFIGSSADPYSAGIEHWVKLAAAAYGVTVVADLNYPAGTTDFSPFIQSAMSASPDAIYLGGVTQEVLPVAKQFYQMGIRDLPIVHNSGATPTQAEQIIGTSLYNQVMANNYDFAGTLPQTSTDPATQTFFADFSKTYNEYPDDLTMWAYDAPYIVVAAMQQAGTVTDQQKIYQAMLTMKVPAGTVSGWIPTDTGLLFHDRDARTLSEGTQWCTATKTIAPAFLYFLDGMNFTHQDVVANGCGG